MRKICFGVIFAIAVTLAGCANLAYYGQAASGQISLWWHSHAVEDVLANPDLPAKTREQLLASQAARNFASLHLGLPDNQSYRRYADLGRTAAVWNVIATRPDRLEPYLFCPPLVGCLPYQGFFNETAARSRATELQKEGWETLVYGIPAYSTLGWFADPLLNTFLNQPQPELAGLIFHELTHQQVYVANDTAFNESLATFVEEEGTHEWLISQARGNDLARWQERRERGAQIRARILAARDEMAALYSQHPKDWLQQKNVRLAQLKSELTAIWQKAGATPKGIWFDEPLGNAHFLLIATYHDLVPAWRRIFAESQGLWPVFWAKSRQLSSLPDPARLQALRR